MIKVTKDPATEIVPAENHTAVLTPMDMLNRAVQSGASMEMMEKLLDLQERWERGQARKSFDAAIAAAKAKIPVIEKKRQAKFDTKNGGKTAYNYEGLADIAAVVDPILSENGLSYRYRSKQEGTIVFVTCVISHRDGHSEETTLSAANDTSGSKNSIQAIGSTITYLQRYALKLALGLAATKDDDAKAVDVDEPISEAQLSELIAFADECEVDKIRFCETFEIDSLADIRKSQFQAAKDRMALKKRYKNADR